MISTGVFQWLFIVLGLSIWITYTSSKEIRVVCYYTNWSVYRPGTAKFSPQNINPYMCTHLVYAFGGFTKENTLKPFDKYQDIEKGGYAKFTGLKTYNKDLKTLLAIGGWNEASSRFSPMVASPDRRKQLVKNSIKFLRQNHFDGLDLDWEYPSFREGGKPRDKDNYAKLVQELREEFERESEKTGRTRLLLTMAVPAGIEYINKGYDIPKLTKYLDWMNILSYDYHSAFEPAVNHHAPLYPIQEATEYDYDVELNIDYTIKHYLELGADPSKLVVGIPTYGRSYTLFNPDANAMGDPADGPGEMGEATRENGYLAYYEICENIKSNDWAIVQPNEKAMGPYAFKENQWVGFDDEKIVRRKAEYVAENGLGGIMFWAIDNDDFRGNCHGKPYPLIEAGKEALISSYGLTDENSISPSSKPTNPKNRHRNRQKTTTEPAIFEGSTKSSVSRRRNRIKSKASTRASESDDRSKPRRKETTSTYSSLKVITPAYTTPEPPSTPDQGGAFKCEDEGFFPHPKDCKKYFWCLSGPGELGTVAHQFTCPAGLYFNKAADSCDYSQNVFCNKKLSKTTSTTEGKKNTESAQKVSTTTQRSTKAPSTRPTLRTTTTEPYEDDYIYEDDDENDSKLDAEEDPKVIKELLDLIKKAGGIEELEKQLKIGNGEQENGATTPSTKTKSIVEKLLISRNNKNENSGKSRYSFINRNSRGPQNEGLKQADDNESKTTRHKTDKRPQYTSILRKRPSTPSESLSEIQDNEEDDDGSKQVNLKYTSLNRNRDKFSTENSINRDLLDRNKILGEDDEDIDNSSLKETNIHTTPHYVNIRRQRPSTTEEPSTSKYASIRRSTTIGTPDDEKEFTTIKTDKSEQTTNVTQQTSTSRYKTLNRHSTLTTQLPTTEKNLVSEALTTTTSEPAATIPTSASSTEAEHQITVTENSMFPSSTILVSTSPESEKQSAKPPVLFEPRPFSIESKPTISTTHKPLRPTLRSTTSSSKVSGTTVRSRFRSKLNSDKNLSHRVFGGDNNSVELGSSKNNDSGRPSRTRSRFHRPDSLKSEATTHLPIRQRTRPTSTERVDKDEDEYQRKYRPLTLDDLSSLTAADITIQESNRGVGFRRTRLRTTTLDTSSEDTTRDSITSTTKKILNRSKSSFVSSSFFKRKNDITDQVEANTNDITFKRQNQKEVIPTSSESSRRSPHRMRKVIRRLRTSTAQPTISDSPITIRGKPFSISSLNIHNLDSSEVSNIFIGDSESNEANYSEENTEEDENIKLSATNIRENSNTNNANAIFERKYGRLDKVDSIFEKTQYDSKPPITTESNIQRTRKIVRKLRPTSSTVEYVITTEASSPILEASTKRNFGRSRKIIRRFRPNSKTTSYKDDSNEKIDDNSREYIGRSTTPQFSDKRSQYLTRSRNKFPRKFTLKHLTSTENILSSDTSQNLINKFQENSEEINNSEETQTTRGRLRYVDIVRSTVPLVTSTDRYEEITNSEDEATSTILPSMEDTTTQGYELKNIFTTSNTFITNEDTSYVPSLHYSESTTNGFESTETAEAPSSSLGNYEEVTTSFNLVTNTDDVTTTSDIQASSIPELLTDAESSTFDSVSSTIAPVPSTENMTNLFSVDDLTTSPPLSSTETTTPYIRRSTLRTAGLRPTYVIRRTTSSTTTVVPQDIKPTENNQRPSFNRRKHIFRPKPLSKSSVSSENITEKPRRKYTFNKYGRTATTLSSHLSSENDTDVATKSSTTPKSRLKYLSERHKILGTTEPINSEEITVKEVIQSTLPTTIDSPITKSNDIEKQRLKNNALFFKKKRKMNIPTFLQTSSKEEPTTEYLTTLYHVFAEPAEGENETSIITKNETHINNGGKIERVVEINRIVKVHVKNGNENNTVEKENATGILDKIGAINRVTSIKVVDGNRPIDQTNQRLTVVHDIIEQELENERKTNQRKDRKFGINISNNIVNGLGTETSGAEIIDGISHIKVITPRPIQLAEASTIALEGLFTKDSPKTEHTEDVNDENTTTALDNELLDADYSRFVNIRVLKPEDGRSLDEVEPADTPRVIRIIPNHEDVTMKAKVVEVTPNNSNQTIRIAPIQVSMSRAIADVPIIGLSKLNEKISNTPFRPNVDSGVP